MTAPPRLQRDPVELPTLGGSLPVVWEVLCRLADALGDLPWTVIGGQMVFLHAAEQAVDVHRVSADIDAGVDVSADPAGLKKLICALTDLGFESCGESPEGHAHRFEKRTEAGVASFDLSVDPDDIAVQEDRTRLRAAAAKLPPDHPALDVGRHPGRRPTGARDSHRRLARRRGREPAVPGRVRVAMAAVCPARRRLL